MRLEPQTSYSLLILLSQKIAPNAKQSTVCSYAQFEACIADAYASHVQVDLYSGPSYERDSTVLCREEHS